MKAIIIGNGQLGSYIFKKWNNFNNIQINVIDYPEFDITNKLQCLNLINEYDIIINCAAYTLVDKAEEQFYTCMQINSNGPLNLAYYCKKFNKKLIHISTESVYGSNDLTYTPIKESDIKQPKNIYALSKLNGDNNIEFLMNENYIILRVGWLFGPNNNHNFIEKIKQLLSTKQVINVVNDQIGSLTYVGLVLDVIKEYLNNNLPSGIYNVANQNYTSRYENAIFINSLINSKCKVLSCDSTKFKRIANISKNSCLNCSKLKQYYKNKILTWKDAIKLLFQQSKINK